MKITVLGCGRWGAFHAWYAAYAGHEVTLWGRPGSAHFAELAKTRKNEYLQLPPQIKLTDDLQQAVAAADYCLIAIGTQSLRSFAQQLCQLDGGRQKKYVLCMKGLEIGTGKRLTQVFTEEMGEAAETIVWVGPGHVQDFIRGIPNCMVLAAANLANVKEFAAEFSSELIRFYYGRDLLGIEIGAAAKNVMGLAAGMLDGFSYGSLKGALMARGTAELSRLIAALGGHKMTVYGLSHLGDYEATLFSPYSHNRLFGESFVQGKHFAKLAEGVYTAEALMTLAKENKLELPICETVYRIIKKGEDPQEALKNLFMREVKEEGFAAYQEN